MKKIVFIAFIFFSSLSAFAINDEIIFDSNKQDKTEKNLLEHEHEVVLEPPIELEKNPYSKDSLKGIVQKEYTTDSLNGLFHDQLKLKLKKGPLEEVGTQLNLQSVFSHSFNDESTKYKMQTVNLRTYGKFKNKKESFSLLFDLAPNGHQNYFKHFILDATIETNRIKNHTLSFGTSRPMTTPEGGMSTFATPFLSRSQAARTFGTVRKTGLKLEGNYKYADYEIGGYSSDTWYSEFLPGVETNLWLNIKPLANLPSEKYGKLKLGGGYQIGDRNNKDFSIISSAISYNYKKMWFKAEYQNADGYNGAGGCFEKKAQGYSATLGYKLTKKLELLFRYDYFDPNKSVAKNDKKEYTAGINYYIFGQATRLILNYVFCDNQNQKDSHRLILGTQLML